MNDREKAHRSALLKRLFASLQYSGKASPEDVRDAYLIALGGVSNAALEKAVDEFTTTGVEGHNGINVPTTQQLVRRAAVWQARLYPKHRALPPPEKLPSIAERKRVGAKLIKLADQLAANEADAKPPRRYRDDAARDPRPLDERLGKLARA